MSFAYVYSKAGEMTVKEIKKLLCHGNFLKQDIAILKKLAPECDDLTCSGSGHMFHSILPPVSNHFAQDSEDYNQRINRLSDDELIYIVEMIQKGEESMGCLPVEDVEAFVHLVHDRLSPEMAQKVISAYEGGGECEH